MNCSSDYWKEDLVVLGRCVREDGRRRRRRIRKRVEQALGSFDRRV